MGVWIFVVLGVIGSIIVCITAHTEAQKQREQRQRELDLLEKIAKGAEKGGKKEEDKE